MKRLVFFTGAGMSAESGLPTFRGRGGIWDEIDARAVASREAWYCGRRHDARLRRQRVLDFFNPIRRAILSHEPNEGHRLIAALEARHEVTVITQNGDDFHERAGSTQVIHLHGEALRNASTLHPHESYPIAPAHPDLHIGDKAPDGSQLRPYVVFFGEDLEMPLWRRAVNAIRDADALVVVGSTLLVHPAADLLAYVRTDCPLWCIDPEEVTLPEGCRQATCLHLCATDGLRQLCKNW